MTYLLKDEVNNIMQSYPKIILSATVILGLLPFKVALSATLPDAATPGGALPRSLEHRTIIADDSDKLIIPRVIDRPLGVDEGDRVKVKEFVLKGVESHPEFNIRKEDVAFIAEANRVNRQRIDEADMEGFTPEEVDEIAEFVRQLVEEPNQRPTSANLWKLVFKLRKSEWSRGLTMGQIQEVADEITRYYRQQGMILATAFIPSQDVVDGKVTIEILEGKLGAVVSEGNSMYSDAMIRRPFKPSIGKPVTKDQVETGLLYLTDYPGLSVNGIFRPGKNQGETDLLIKVIDEARINGVVSLDNNGSEFTGEYRTRLNVVVNSPTGNADRLSLTALQSFEPAQGTFGNVSYTVPVMRSDWIVAGSLSYNQFEIDDDELGGKTTGDSTIANGLIKKIFHRSRAFNSHFSAELSRKKAVTVVVDADEKEDEYDVGRLEIGLDAIDTRFSGINLATLQFHHGIGTRLGASGFDELATTSDVKLKGGFQKVNFDFSRLQTIRRNFALLITSQFQYTNDRLNSLEQLPLGGADSVRAFPISEYLRDVGYFTSLEFILNAPGFADKPAFAGRRWGEIFSVSAFYDVGGGWLRDVTASETREVHLQGAGVGVKASLPGKFSARFQVATVVGKQKHINDNATEQYYFDVAYYF